MKKPKRKLSGWALYEVIANACWAAHGKPLPELKGRYDVKTYRRAARDLTEHFKEDAC